MIRVVSGQAREPLADTVEHAGAEPMLEFDPTELLVPLVRREGFAHFVFPRPDGTDFLSNPDSLSVAWITNNGQRLGQRVGNFWLGNLRTQPIAIQQQGGWDNAVDLFPALGLL